MHAMLVAVRCGSAPLTVACLCTGKHGDKSRYVCVCVCVLCWCCLVGLFWLCAWLGVRPGFVHGRKSCHSLVPG